MKIKITYETEDELQNILEFPLQYHINAGVKLRKSDHHPPFKHAYLSIRNDANEVDIGNSP